MRKYKKSVRCGSLESIIGEFKLTRSGRVCKRLAGLGSVSWYYWTETQVERLRGFRGVNENPMLPGGRGRKEYEELFLLYDRGRPGEVGAHPNASPTAEGLVRAYDYLRTLAVPCW